MEATPWQLKPATAFFLQAENVATRQAGFFGLLLDCGARQARDVAILTAIATSGSDV
jgi:hypothetical protein